MILALQEVAELAPGIIGFYRSGSCGRLDAYSSTRLPQIWRAVEFSHRMPQMLLAHRIDTPEREFHEGLRATRLARLKDGGTLAKDFALTYVSIDRQLRLHAKGVLVDWRAE